MVKINHLQRILQLQKQKKKWLITMSSDSQYDWTDEEKEQQKQKIGGADFMIYWLHCFDWQVSDTWSAVWHKKQHLRRKQRVLNWWRVVNGGSKLFPQRERGKQCQL